MISAWCLAILAVIMLGAGLVKLHIYIAMYVCMDQVYILYLGVHAVKLKACTLTVTFLLSFINLPDNAKSTVLSYMQMMWRSIE